MTANPSASDWAATRGAQWLAQVAGMEAMLSAIEEPLIAAARLDAPYRIADIACGGGKTTRELKRLAPRGSVVHGFDISTVLIEYARLRPQSDADFLTFSVADVAKAAPKEAYQRLVSRFGVMFFDDPEAAFLNLARWLKPRGRFAFATWGPPSDNAWLGSVREAVARVVDIPELDLTAPGPFRYADANQFLTLLERCGFSDLAVRDWQGALPIGGALQAAAAASFALSVFSSFKEVLVKAGESAYGEVLRSLTARFAEHERDGAVWLDARVNIVTGMRL